MINRRFIALFFISFSVVLISGLLWLNFFYLPQHVQFEQPTEDSSAYKEINIIMPVQEFLKRGANSQNLSTVKRVLVNQWIYFNQDDLIKLIMYAQGAMSFEELRKAFLAGIETENCKNGATSFVSGSLDVIAKDPTLIKHVNKSLKEGFSPEIHGLRGKIMESEPNNREHKKLKIKYRKALYDWIDKKHGSLLDELSLQI
jgi:hypothetical protein